MLSILLWWAAPLTAAVLAAITMSVARRIRTAREDMETMDRYQKARAALARASASGEAATAGTTPQPAGGRAARRAGGRSQRGSGRSRSADGRP